MEKIIDISTPNVWREYTVDMSAAKDFTTISKILIVVSPGVAGSSDTYYLDNIYTTPNYCAGSTPNADILDDFECNRVAAYGGGWDSLHVVTNPYPNGDNNTSRVGKFNDQAGPWYGIWFPHDCL
ncbi:MAG: hypothetical protein IPL65_13505 [Lewinellaceae bacterium]|nr:hypothetical protein [Lewinellaceae bacterium]